MNRDTLDAVGLLIEIRDALRSIDARLAKDSGNPDPLLQALHAAVGPGVAFSCGELISRANVELLEVIGEDPVALGRRLSKLEGRGVHKIGRDEFGVVWSLR